MKTQIIATITTLIMSACQSTKAQTFNTITNSQPHYKVELPVVNKTKESSPESDTSTVHVPLAKDTSYKKTEQLGYPLSISYPLRQSKLIITSSPYGMRKHPVTGKMTMHQGVDLRANYEAVYAMLPGEVLNTGYEPKGGNFISLRHGSLKVTYCHLSVIGVKKGTTVYAGQPIGVSGNSGKYTTGPHLHLGVKNLHTNTPLSASELLAIIARQVM